MRRWKIVWVMVVLLGLLSSCEPAGPRISADNSQETEIPQLENDVVV